MDLPDTNSVLFYLRATHHLSSSICYPERENQALWRSTSPMWVLCIYSLYIEAILSPKHAPGSRVFLSLLTQFLLTHIQGCPCLIYLSNLLIPRLSSDITFSHTSSQVSIHLLHALFCLLLILRNFFCYSVFVSHP